MAHVNDTRKNQYLTTLLGVDRAGSVLATHNDHQRNSRSYTVYGDKPSVAPEVCKTGFVGELLDALGGHYLLGNGVRAYAQTLMRFRSPDALSPFGAGGINTYAYCSGDPVNFADRTGRTRNRVPSLTGMTRAATSSGYAPKLNYPRDQLIAAEKLYENIYGGPITTINKMEIFKTEFIRTTLKTTENFSKYWSSSESNNDLSNALSFNNALHLLSDLISAAPEGNFYIKASSQKGGDLFGIKALGMYKTEEQLVFNLLRPYVSLLATLHDPSTPSWRAYKIREFLSSREDIQAGMRKIQFQMLAFAYDAIAYRQPSP
jgi:RHS repeat-associated protein